MQIRSEINPMLTLDYITTADENKYFDRKSSQIRPSDLASHISAFANAEGGTIVVGVSDKTKTIEGINNLSQEKVNDFISAAKEYCKPMPICDTEFIGVKNYKGEEDRILLLHIRPSGDQIIRTSNDSTYLRMGDRTKELKGEDYKSLEYNKSIRRYEDEPNHNANIDDLDKELLVQYKGIIGAEALSDEQVLKARGMLVSVDNKEVLTNAAVLLFAKNILQFYPNCRVRFLRYDGNYAGVGTDINIIKDVNIELPLTRIIDKAKEFVSSQLRDFTALDKATGKFKVVPEYPEFAWLEGITNAVTHREYAMEGAYIKIAMFDDRLEIESPGKLPNIVTVENIRDTRYSRNPIISRVLTEFGYVRELNEGVKRIYSDMKSLFLDEPEYSEPGGNSVKLVLKNNILMRTLRQVNRAAESVGEDVWNELDDLEKMILTYMSNHKRVRRIELEGFTGKAGRTIGIRLNKLIDKGLVQRNGEKNDPHQTYEMVL